MSSIYGKNIKVSVFGQSHSEAVGVTIDGLPAGYELDRKMLQRFMGRRAPGLSKYGSGREESDVPHFIAGLSRGKTCGAPLTAVIVNKDARPEDYDNISNTPRPGHADMTAQMKYGGFQDKRGGGHFSGRLTAPICVAGGIFMQILRKEYDMKFSAELIEAGGDREDPYGAIEKAKSEGDSVGGIIECHIVGIPAGAGEPMFDGIENRISQAIFAIPGVKGIEFGDGFECARMRGSENNDAFKMSNVCEITTETNHNGGILGGISTGGEIIFRVAMKPTPSIEIEQNSVNMKRWKNEKIRIKGRHDPCIAVRAVPVVEAAAAMAVMDLIYDYRGGGVWY